MKKLALALVCLVSVAFFASCDPKVENPEPAIAALTGEGYLADSAVIEANVDYPFGFIVTSNPDTQKDIVRVELLINDEPVDTVENIDAQTYTYESIFRYDTREVIDEVVIALRATDADNQTQTAKIRVWVNEEAYLVANDFTWNRHGGADGTGLEPFGLKWERNAKEVFAVIEPLEGALMYRFDPAVWETIQTEAQLAALFSEATTIDNFKEVSCEAVDKDYDVVLGTTYQGINYLIHVTHSHVFTFKGTDVTITGQYK